MSENENMLPADPIVSTIERVATDPNASIEKLEKMLAMKERMDAQAARAEHASAFAHASAEFPAIPLNGDGHNKKPYALLKDILSMTRPALSKYGLALNFDIATGDTVRVTARLSHVSGHVETVSIDLPRDGSGSKNAVQAIGSSQTYGQRYTAQAILGLSLGDDTDDDGRSAAPRKATISEEQFFELRGLIERARLDENIVLKAERIDTLEELPEAKFGSVKSNLMANIRRLEGGPQ